MKRYFLIGAILGALLPLGAVETLQQFLNFDDGEKYTVAYYNGSGEAQLGSNVKLSGDAASIMLRERKFPLTVYQSPLRAVVSYDLRGKASLRLTGFNGKTAWQSPAVALDAAKTQAVIDLTGAGADFKFAGVEVLNPDRKVDLTLQKMELNFDASTVAGSVGITVDCPLAIVRPGDKVPLNVTNFAQVKQDLAVQLELKSFYGETVKSEHKLSLDPGKSGRVELAPLPVNGYWQLKAVFADKSVRTTAFAVLPGLPDYTYNQGDFMFGICTHTARWSVKEQQLEALAAAQVGVNFARTGMEWGNLQKAPGPIDFAEFDQIYNVYAKQHIMLQGMFAFCARFAAPEELQKSEKYSDWSRAKPDLTLWRDYVKQCATHYKGKIQIWEIWNEPDLWTFAHFSVEDYLELAAAASDELRKVDSNITIFTGGFAGLADLPNRRDPEYQLKAMRGGRQYFDVHAYHGHSAFGAFSRQIDDKLLPLRRQAEVKIPWYANETAISAINNNEVLQADSLFKKLLFCWSRGAIGYNWYDLRNDGFAAGDPEHHFGLYTNDFVPKPVMAVYHTLAAHFRGAAYRRQLELGRGIWAFEFVNHGKTLLPAWVESGDGNHLFLLDNVAGEVRYFDLMGNGKTVAADQGIALASVSRIPGFWELANPADLKPFLEVLPVLDDGKGKGTVTVKVVNPLNRKLAVNLSVGPAKQQIELAANTATEVEIVADDLKNNQTVVCEIAGTKLRAELALPVQTATRIPAGSGDYKRKPDFTLSSKDQLVSLTEGDPALRDLAWQGPDDLSAIVFLRMDNEVLELYAGVRDDVQRSDKSGNAIWQQDSLQVALVIPGQDGQWKIGLAQIDGNKPETFIWEAPKGFDPALCGQKIKLSTHRDEAKKTLAYRARFDLAAFGLTPEILRQGIRFNLLINDNDGNLRESFLQLAPGISEWRNFNQFPLLVFE